MSANLGKTEDIVKAHGGHEGQLIGILQDIQTKHNYLPRKELEKVSELLSIPISRVYAVATFFKALSLKPRGKHVVHVCMGTACHVRGAKRILEECERKLDVKEGETTKDKEFTLETVNCVGACALGPVIVVDGKYHGKIGANKVDKLIDGYKAKKGGND